MVEFVSSCLESSFLVVVSSCLEALFVPFQFFERHPVAAFLEDEIIVANLVEVPAGVVISLLSRNVSNFVEFRHFCVAAMTIRHVILL